MADVSISSTRTPISWSSSTVIVILSSSLIGVMGVSLISPALPALRSVFNVTDAQIGLLITAYTFPGIFITPFIGLIADRFGRRRVLVPLLLIFGISGASIGGITDFRLVLTLRLIQGVGATALVTLAVTLIGDFYDGNQRAALIGVNGSLLAVGAALYPLIGGALASVRWNLPFLFFGVSIFVGLLAFLALDEPTGESTTHVRIYLVRLHEAAWHPQLLAIFAGLLIIFIVFFGAVFTATPLLLSDEFGLSSGAIGAVLSMASLGSAITAWQFWRLSGWLSMIDIITLGFVVCGVSLGLIWFAPSFTLVALSLFGFGVGIGMIMPAIDNTLLSLITSDLRAGLMGIRTSMIRMGQTLGPVAITFAAGYFFPTTVIGYRVLVFVSGSVLVVTGIVAQLGNRWLSMESLSDNHGEDNRGD